MNLIKEDYVSFETANLLKTKGFDECCIAHYRKNKDLIAVGHGIGGIKYSWIENKETVLAPTQALALKWLRIKHKIHIQIHQSGIEKPYYLRNNEWYVTIQSCKILSKRIIQRKRMDNFLNKKFISSSNGLEPWTFEQATEAAIIDTLNNLI